MANNLGQITGYTIKNCWEHQCGFTYNTSYSINNGTPIPISSNGSFLEIPNINPCDEITINVEAVCDDVSVRAARTEHCELLAASTRRSRSLTLV